MEFLAYSSMFDANETAEPELGLPEIQFNYQKFFNQNLFKSTSLTLASLGLVFATFGEAQAAVRGFVRTNGSCLNLRTKPSLNSRVVGCLPNGSRIGIVVDTENGFSRLNSGYYVSTRYISARAGGGTTIPGPGVGGPVTLGVGSAGAPVSQVQRRLGIQPTGYYGSITERAVRNFQVNNGLLADGKVGAQTRIALGL
ncbi:peptidoglycan-binding domain 1 [Calothrix sp. NIES-4071]|nr:peptidoglycan-binding domain 1 [Calothrix sp. NIES-4071]BAZ61866.1 peptidoglycan-binding domain 1 [Calothrix sp. NIES-4105]